MNIQGSNVTINVRDLDKSVSFYESIGIKVMSRWSNHYAQLTVPGMVIGLHPTGESNLAGNSGNISLGFTTDDFEDAESLLQKLSLKFTERKEEGGHFLHFTDPDGTALYFIKPKK
jgi:catechol 2,3-dioxygenase-like lactoylglutathione lyase family enzyme